MSELRPSVLTIGHSTHSVERFLALLTQHEVTLVADVRSAPHSRFNPQFNKEALKRSLESSAIDYRFMGRELGARSNDSTCYENGQVRYALLAHTDLFRAGIEMVIRAVGDHRVALMCAEKEPLECHRTVLIARVLVDVGVDVVHVLGDGRLEPHVQTMERLLDVTGIPRQDLFRSRAELLAEALALQEERIAYVDRKLAAEAASDRP